MKKIHWSIFLILILIVVPAASAVIAAEDQDDEYDYEMVVTATRTPQKPSEAPGETEVISKREVQNSGATTVSEALDSNGVPIPSYGGSSGTALIQIDGSTSEQTLVLINGIPANTGCLGSADLSYFPVIGIKKVEVVHGPLSSLYGANALGGVVNIMTDLTGEPGTTLNAGLGSFQTADLGFAVQQKQWGLALGGNLSDGFRVHSKTDNSYLMGQYDFYENSKENAILRWQYFSKNAQTPGSVSYASQGYEQDRNYSMDLSGKKTINENTLEYQVFAQYLDYRFNSDHHQTQNYGFDAAGIHKINHHELVGGISYKYSIFDSTVSQNHMQNNLGIFIQDNWGINPDLQLVAGLRWDTNSNYQSPISPRLYLIKTWSEGLNVKVGYGRSFRAPTINELYWNQPDWGMFGNQNLKPEEGERFDLQGEWKKGHQKITVDIFQSHLTNGIRWVEEPRYVYTAQNVASTKIDGLNVNWRNQWTDFFATRLAYRWADQHIWGDTSLPDGSRNNFFGASQWEFGTDLAAGAFGVQVNWKLVSDRTPQYGQKMSDYQLVDLILNYTARENLALTLSLNNIFNQQYQIYNGYPMAGSEYRIGLRYTF